MKSTFKKFALLGTLIFGLSAQAGVLIEPYMGYATGKTKNGSTSDTTSGVIYGGRLGFQQLGFMGGIDYMSGKLTTDSSPKKQDVTPNDLGVFAGFNFPVMLRVYGVYYFNPKATVATSGFADSKMDGGTGVKLGVGFTGLPFVSVNLEYMSETYKKSDGVTMTNSTTSDMIGVTVSLPLDI